MGIGGDREAQLLEDARHVLLDAAFAHAAQYPEGPPLENWSVSLEGGLEQHDAGMRLDS